MNIEDINALIDGTATIESKIRILPTDDEEEIVITQDDLLKSWNYEDFRYVPEIGFIGMFVERTLEGELNNDIYPKNVFNFNIVNDYPSDNLQSFYFKNDTLSVYDYYTYTHNIDITDFIRNNLGKIITFGYESYDYTPDGTSYSHFIPIQITYRTSQRDFILLEVLEDGTILGSGKIPEDGDIVSATLHISVSRGSLTISKPLIYFPEENPSGIYTPYINKINLENREIELLLGIRRYPEDNSEGVTTFYSLGNFIVDKPDSDEVKDDTSFTSRDYTLKFNTLFNPDYTDDEFTESFTTRLRNGEDVTALWLAQYTCKQVGVELGNTDFENADFLITSNQFNSEDQCRDVMKAIGKLAFSWVRIDWDNKCYIDFKQSNEVKEYNHIDKDHYYELEVQKEPYGVVNKVVVGSSIIDGDYSYREDAESIEENGETALVINDNPILNTEELRESAMTPASRLFGLKYTPLTIETTGHPWLKGNELISTLDSEDNVIYTYPFDRTISYNGHIRTTLSSTAETMIEEDYDYKGSASAYGERKNTKRTLDRDQQIITDLVENVTEQDEKITKVVQDTEKILQEVSHLVDLTIEDSSTNAKLSFEDLMYGYPLNLKIHPINESILGLYPSDDIYPTNEHYDGVEGLVPYVGLTPNVGLKPNKRVIGQDAKYPMNNHLVFHNTTEDTMIYYNLPTLFFYDGEHYDEFELDYGNQQCFIRKRIGQNLDGTLYVLDEEEIVKLNYPEIEMQKGSYEIYLEGYHFGYIYGKFVVQSEYTDIFAPRVEMYSAINQTATDITLQVEKKTSSEEIINKINVGTEEINITGNRLVIDSDNFKLSRTGDVTLASGAKIIGGEGLLTSMIIEGSAISYGFFGITSLAPLGSGDSIQFEFVIPKNFHPSEAYIHLSHVPTRFTWYDEGTSPDVATGYSRNLQLYKMTDFGSGMLNISYVMEDRPTYTGITFEMVDNVFGYTGFTGKTSGYTEYITDNIVSALNTSRDKDVFNILKIQSTNVEPSSLSERYRQTGTCKATLTIMGYTSDIG